METYLIVHGGWAGGWYFKDTAKILRAAGHEVHTPTLTGIGERVHLGHSEVNLDTHIEDIANVLKFEDLKKVILVGYSYGGMVSTGVMHRHPERIAQTVYLDGLVPENGQACIDILPGIGPMISEAAIKFGDGWKVPHDPPQPRKTHQPIKTFTQPILFEKNKKVDVPRTYILCKNNTFPFAPVLAETAKEAKERGWRCYELHADHIAPETHPEDVANILLQCISK